MEGPGVLRAIVGDDHRARHVVRVLHGEDIGLARDEALPVADPIGEILAARRVIREYADRTAEHGFDAAGVGRKLLEGVRIAGVAAVHLVDQLERALVLLAGAEMMR
ncbi:hypothetical protein JQX13_31980 [Archangium violaceum]|uniref:hypothetical protein n=1 Tax=Archangium violaceum TaxID=83451 RepID=UPI00193B5F3F|nr:hypothetical protein [Archangium violaceum]QRK04825.1 hypothetical protein JQX13_31980 [Archangium violaceum]